MGVCHLFHMVSRGEILMICPARSGFFDASFEGVFCLFSFGGDASCAKVYGKDGLEEVALEKWGCCDGTLVWCDIMS